MGAKRFILLFFASPLLCKSLNGKVGYWFYHRVIWESLAFVWLLTANFLDPSDWKLAPLECSFSKQLNKWPIKGCGKLVSEPPEKCKSWKVHFKAAVLLHEECIKGDLPSSSFPSICAIPMPSSSSWKVWKGLQHQNFGLERFSPRRETFHSANICIFPKIFFPFDKALLVV